MPKLATEQTTEPDIELTDQQRTELALNFRTYASLLAEMDDLQESIDAQKGELARLRDNLGVKSIGVEGVGRTTLVAGATSKRFDKKKQRKYLLVHDVPLAVIDASVEAATVEKAKKDYELVTIAGRNSTRHDEDDK